MRYRLRTLLICMAILLMYLASYRALMLERVNAEESDAGVLLWVKRTHGYQFGEPIARVVFCPLAWIDKQLWPRYWGELTDFQGRRVGQPPATPSDP
jgi:hypothetical protein